MGSAQLPPPSQASNPTCGPRVGEQLPQGQTTVPPGRGQSGCEASTPARCPRDTEVPAGPAGPAKPPLATSKPVLRDLVISPVAGVLVTTRPSEPGRPAFPQEAGEGWALHSLLRIQGRIPHIPKHFKQAGKPEAFHALLLRCQVQPACWCRPRTGDCGHQAPDASKLAALSKWHRARCTAQRSLKTTALPVTSPTALEGM